VRFPEDYREFLLKYGALSVLDSSVSGVVGNNPLDSTAGSLYGDTVRFRSQYGLPARYLVLQPDDDAPYCFDMDNVAGHPTVVCYELHTGHAKVIASNFKEWLQTYVFGSDAG
jgi:hypothetical protein